MLVVFEGVSRPIALEGCEHLRSWFAEILPGWHFEEAPAARGDPIIRILRDDEGYRLESPWLDDPFLDDTEVGTVCAFILDLIAAYLDERPSLFGLHCAAAELDGRLVVFPSPYRAGKSTLAARLSASGTVIFTDDVLPVTVSAEHGVALGVAPRLRLPLPRRAGRDFRRFVAQHGGRSNDSYLYLNLPLGTLAPHGRRAPIGGIVMLDRQRKGEPRLVPASKSQILQRLILQHFARSVAATEMVERLRVLVERVPCFCLSYCDLDEAVALVRERFATWPAAALRPRAAVSERRAVSRPASRPRRAATERGKFAIERGFRQSPAVDLHAVENELFLVDPRDESIFHLNLVGAGLWRLLSEPSTATQAVDVLQTAFPAADPQQIKRDVCALLGDLLDHDLIVAHDPPGAARAGQLAPSPITAEA